MKMKDGSMNDRTDIKIFILFLLNEINEPLDYPTIADVMAENGYVGSFDFAEAFSELCDRGHILKKEESGKAYYEISDTGRMVASELQSDLLESIREKSRRTTMRLLSLRSKGLKATTEILPREDGKYTVICELVSPTGVLCRTETAVSTKEEAAKFKRNFEKNPTSAYRGIYAVLSGEVDYLLS